MTFIQIIPPLRHPLIIRVARQGSMNQFFQASTCTRIVLNEDNVSPGRVDPIRVIGRGVNRAARSSQGKVFVKIISAVRVGPAPLRHFDRANVACPIIVFTVTIVRANLRRAIHPFIRTRRTKLWARGFAYGQAAVFRFNFTNVKAFNDCRGRAAHYFYTVGDDQDVFRGIGNFSIVNVRLDRLTRAAN